ncbi:MAG: rhamnulokinase family protein [Planctomycetota bacterium]
MASRCHYLALDLGASSGRAMLGGFDGTRLTLEEVHRFENGPVHIHGALYWDAFRLFEQVRAGIGRCGRRGVKLDGVGIDTWGVDFGLLARGGELLAMPRHYRDPRHAAAMGRMLARVPRADIYERTGIQFLPFNSLYQLAGMAEERAKLPDVADRLLFMPDLLVYWLTGVAGTEPTIASTSQMLNPRSTRWDFELVERAGAPVRILPGIANTGTPVGDLTQDVAAEVGQAARVIRTAGHDTACAVAAVPATGGNWAYISSGTWSLVGVELREPLITPASLAADFTNEVGVGGTIRFLRNVAGLWLVQEAQRTWAAAGQHYSWDELARMAEGAPALAAFVDPDDPQFAPPGDMPARIRAACAATGQVVPETPGAVVRCALESLALKVRRVLHTLEALLLRSLEVVHVVGGGSQNRLLNQFIADATGKPVIAGPVEATALGNVLIQALGQGRIGSTAELRQVVAASTALSTFEPRAMAAWEDAAGRFERVLAAGGDAGGPGGRS